MLMMMVTDLTVMMMSMVTRMTVVASQEHRWERHQGLGRTRREAERFPQKNSGEWKIMTATATRTENIYYRRLVCKYGVTVGEDKQVAAIYLHRPPCPKSNKPNWSNCLQVRQNVKAHSRSKKSRCIWPLSSDFVRESICICLFVFVYFDLCIFICIFVFVYFHLSICICVS